MLEETLLEYLKAGQAKAEARGEAKGRSEGLREGQAQGRRLGLREGKAKGRREGVVKGLRAGILRLLAQRFGKLPLPVRRKVAALRSVAELERLLDRALTARSLEELPLG